MAIERIYLDYNATAPVLPTAREAALRAMDLAGNPSSVHAEGREARQMVEAARAHVAGLAGLPPDRVIFTSGGTRSGCFGAASGRNRQGQSFVYLRR